MATRVDPAERLLDLVIALAHTTHRMTKSQIRRVVHGYGEAASDEAFERMFDRDKSALRDLGIPLVTQTDDAHADDVGYRIDLAGYELPPLDLTPAEIGLLSLATQVWQDAQFAAVAQRGLTKLRAVAPTAATDLTGLALRVRPPETAFSPLLEAIEQRSAVTFPYRAAGTGREERREVEPWRLVAQDHAWYLRAFDRGRGAERMFRLSRITGPVRRSGRAGVVEIPAGLGESAPARRAAGTARLALRPERAAALRARAIGPVVAGGDRDVVEIPMPDAEELAQEIAAFTDAVVVLEPLELRDAVLHRLASAAALGEGHDG
ncbi:transcriptional regulator-like protein [Beutenbergia cavernae DSM 12333]|uniref:Transcriptional regulator-like protein n=1 Tax=Beutenbergia cavernae (strain ATCC BAA-8 / DSM 12333 / CCUG 43141 / JCM 11478 / NBRC 16432 / NCIMB 13614 / HKI 0122) TaxID=471853 RepID=C5C6A6_BEUC1|nr:WYL domain-containing protein [Beutenbergia cavernae]ACQ80312.1 transcriptional regulator-like protein [Beutenbergia cavernae DSM 12333]